MKKHKVLRVVVALLICVVMIVPPVPVSACGPYFPEAFFTFTKHPDFPLDRFAAGDLGVLRSTYARSYLVVAYRYLSGADLDKAEQAAAVSLWKTRLDGGWDSLGDDDSATAEKRWFSTRAKVPGVRLMRSGQDLLPDKNAGDWNHIEATNRYDSHVNCLDPALESAANTLQKRIQQFGLVSPAVQSWVSAQDAVFTLCNGSAPPVYPEPADAALPAIIKADRAYQIAAAHFYARDYETARQQFLEISRDESSSWRATSGLMAARSLIRKTTIFSPNLESEKAGLQEARALLAGIVNDKSMAEMHHAAKDLISFVDARTNPAEYVHSLAQILARPNNTNLQHDLDDYTILLDKWLGKFDDPEWDEVQKTTKRFTGPPATLLPSAIRSDPLTDWVLTFQSGDPTATVRAIQRWRQTGSVAWLIAAMTKVNPSAPEAGELVSASRRVDTESPAYVTLFFNIFRIEALSGRRDSARNELDKLLEGHSAKLPRSSLNIFLGLRMSLAQNLEELLRFAPRVPALIALNEDDMEMPNSTPFFHKVKGDGSKEEAFEQQFDIDGAWTFTRALPTSILVRAVESKTLPIKLRSAVANFAWTRAIVLDDEANAIRLAPLVGKLEPKLASQMSGYAEISDSASRRFSGILTLLRTPGLRPFVGYGIGRDISIEKVENYRDNWWCSLDDTLTRSWENGDSWSDLYSPVNPPDRKSLIAEIHPGGRFAIPQFLSDEDRKVVDGEWKALLKLDIGTAWLARQALDWAKAHPDDSRAPEALHQAVHALRYGCGVSDADSKLSHEAFDLLHRRYPKSEWTKKTPYWF